MAILCCRNFLRRRINDVEESATTPASFLDQRATFAEVVEWRQDLGSFGVLPVARPA